MTDPSIRRERSSEEGIALISALLLGVIGILLTIGLLTYAMGSEPLAKRHTDWNAALGAAQAGVDDYIYRLNKDPEYWRYGIEQPLPTDNPALSQFVDVPGGGSTTSIKPQFKYRVISKPDPSTGARIILEVTGKVGNTERVLRASMARRGFLDYMYFTNYEQSDPVLSDDADKAAAVCTHWYDPDPVTYLSKSYNRADVCGRISFGINDVINGPVHTNDQISISGPVTFNGLVTTSLPASITPRYNSVGSPPTPTWNGIGQGGNPIYATPLELPVSNAKLNAIAEDGGCVYTGPTKITFTNNGKMDVVSPNSTKPVRSGCGTATSTGVNATGLSLPANGVVYVQAKPADTSNKYYTTACSMTGMPTEANKDTDYNRNYWSCTQGDAFISGTLKGRVTIGSERDITVVGDTVYNTPASTTNANSTDMLGLIANNFVQTYHPIKCTTSTTDRRGNTTTTTNFAPSTANMFITSSRKTSAGTCTNINPLMNLKINAAILALKHSFRVPEYATGDKLGDLTVIGAIAQMYRGAVATGSYNATTKVSTISTGYRKDYTYDGRLAYQAPPYFLDPVTSAWRSSNWMETKVNS